MRYEIMNDTQSPHFVHITLEYFQWSSFSLKAFKVDDDFTSTGIEVHNFVTAYISKLYISFSIKLIQIKFIWIFY